VTREQLIAECERIEAERLRIGLNPADACLVLVVPRKSPPLGQRVNVMPGLTGEFLSWHEETSSAVVRVAISKLRRVLGAVRS